MIRVGDAPGEIDASSKVGVPLNAAAGAETAEPEKRQELLPDEIFYTIAGFANWLKNRIGFAADYLTTSGNRN